MKKLILLRGLPGCGKSTLAKELSSCFFEADMYFITSEGYKWDASKMKEAHEWCRTIVEGKLGIGVATVVVSNTFTQEWEMKPYFEMAEKYGYTVFSLVVENRHGGKNVHDVPDEKLQMMNDRFEVKLM